MLPADRIRFHVMEARKLDAGAERDARITDQLAAALSEARRTGDATEGVMTARFGFTRDELARYGGPALDAATERWVRLNAIEQHAA